MSSPREDRPLAALAAILVFLALASFGMRGVARLGEAPLHAPQAAAASDR